MADPSRSQSAATCSVVACVLAAVYAASGPVTLPEADSGEFAAIAVCGGIAHPPGYPVLSLALQSFAGFAPLLGLIPALTAFSILCACVAAVLSVRVLIDRGRSPLVAGAATLAVFLSSHVWRAATSFEPFALNLLLASGILWTCERLVREPAGARSESGWLIALGALFGLGFCNHHSLITLAPLALAAVLFPLRALPRRAAPLLFGAALGLTPLLAFFWLRTQPGFVWGDWHDFGPRLIEHVLRREYGTLTLASSESRGSWAYGPARFIATLPQALSYVFLLVALAGVVRLTLRRRTERVAEGRLDLGIMLGLLASGLLFPLLFKLRGTPLDDLITDRFFALPTWLLLVPLAEGMQLLRASRAVAALWGTLLAAHTALVWPHAERRTHRFYEDHVRNVFEVLEPDSTLLVVADGGFSGGLYGRCVLRRPDVQVVITSLEQPWYVDRLAAARRAEGAKRQHAPLYLLDVPALQRGRPPQTYPVGPLLRVVTGDAAPPSARASFEQNRELFARLRLPDRETVAALDAWEAEELTNYWRTWQLIGRRLEAEGESDLAAAAYRYRDLFPAPGG